MAIASPRVRRSSMGQRATETASRAAGAGAGALVSGKVVIVTGGGTGIGEAIAKVLAKNGAKVVVNGLPGDPASEVAEEISQQGGVAISFTGDVGTLEGAEGLVRAAVSKYGRLDAVVANAGLYPEQHELQDFPLERFDELLHTN